MKKITAFVGSARKGYTLRAAQQFLESLQPHREVETEIVRLSDYRIETCRGCKLCLDRGEELCPLEDDRDVLLAKMDASDGVVFATPNYAFQVSGLMKTFLDRIAFVFHRPRFFGKTFTSIVCQGVYRGGEIVKYLDFVGNGLGFSTVKGTCLTTVEPLSPKAQQALDRGLDALARRYAAAMAKDPFPTPGLFGLMIFRMSRTRIQLMLNDGYRDWRYYRDQGWFESDFYYPTRLGPARKAVGALVDAVTRITTKREGYEAA